MHTVDVTHFFGCQAFALIPNFDLLPANSRTHHVLIHMKICRCVRTCESECEVGLYISADAPHTPARSDAELANWLVLCETRTLKLAPISLLLLLPTGLHWRALPIISKFTRTPFARSALG